MKEILVDVRVFRTDVDLIWFQFASLSRNRILEFRDLSMPHVAKERNPWSA